MKVPTYQAQLQRPRHGQALPLTAQLNASAMAAPAIAHAEFGKQIAGVGSEIAEFGLKRAQVGAESEAAEAAGQMEVDLADLEARMLRNPNMSKAEGEYRAQSQIIIDSYKATMSNRLARGAFDAAAVRIQSRGLLSFTKLNNKRVVEAAAANLSNVTNEHLKAVSDPDSSDIARQLAYVRAVRAIVDAEGDIGALKRQELIAQLHVDVATNTALSYINGEQVSPADLVKELEPWRNVFNPPAEDTSSLPFGPVRYDAAQLAAQFREGTSHDVILKMARENLTPEQINEVATTIEKIAARRALAANDRRNQAEATAKRKDEEIGRAIMFGDGSLEAKWDAFKLISESVHLSVGTLTALRNYLAGGATVDIDADVGAAVLQIRSGEITTDMQLLETIGLEDWTITYETITKLLLPLITQTTGESGAQVNFTRALNWGEAELGYDASMAAGGFILGDAGKKALRFTAEMLEWQYDENKPITDAMLKAREVVKRLKAEGNPKAESRLIMLMAAYRAVLAKDDPTATEIANAKTVLAAAMVATGMVTAIAAMQPDFDPEAVIRARRAADDEQ